MFVKLITEESANIMDDEWKFSTKLIASNINSLKIFNPHHIPLIPSRERYLIKSASVGLASLYYSTASQPSEPYSVPTDYELIETSSYHQTYYSSDANLYRQVIYSENQFIQNATDAWVPYEYEETSEYIKVRNAAATMIFNKTDGANEIYSSYAEETSPRLYETFTAQYYNVILLSWFALDVQDETLSLTEGADHVNVTWAQDLSDGSTLTVVYIFRQGVLDYEITLQGDVNTYRIIWKQETLTTPEVQQGTWWATLTDAQGDVITRLGWLDSADWHRWNEYENNKFKVTFGDMILAFGSVTLSARLNMESPITKDTTLDVNYPGYALGHNEFLEVEETTYQETPLQTDVFTTTTIEDFTVIWGDVSGNITSLENADQDYLMLTENCADALYATFNFSIDGTLPTIDEIHVDGIGNDGGNPQDLDWFIKDWTHSTWDWIGRTFSDFNEQYLAVINDDCADYVDANGYIFLKVLDLAPGCNDHTWSIDQIRVTCRSLGRISETPSSFVVDLGSYTGTLADAASVDGSFLKLYEDSSDDMKAKFTFSTGLTTEQVPEFGINLLAKDNTAHDLDLYVRDFVDSEWDHIDDFSPSSSAA
ncbi:MAG: hypothetical protein HWN68_19890, partial [Desulfobacterales bacterium]|nr:hypothetical protein [Desulfobacterales bacterium]